MRNQRGISRFVAFARIGCARFCLRAHLPICNAYELMLAHFSWRVVVGASLALALLALGCSKPGPDRTHDGLVSTPQASALGTQGDKNVDSIVFIRESTEAQRAAVSFHAQTWHLGEEVTWDADQDTGRIRFTFKDGRIAEADFQIVGTYNTLDGTFLWGWDHPSVGKPLRKHAELAKEFGLKHALANFTQRKVECSKEQAWEFTAVAARLGKATGTYRGPAGTALVYMTFGKVQLSTLGSRSP